MIPLPLTPKQEQSCKEFWPVLVWMHEESCRIGKTYADETRLWVEVKKLAEEAFMLGRCVGREEVKEAEFCVKCGEYIKEVDRFDGTCIDCYEAAKARREA
jgi:hypothetical protein